MIKGWGPTFPLLKVLLQRCPSVSLPIKIDYMSPSLCYPWRHDCKTGNERFVTEKSQDPWFFPFSCDHSEAGSIVLRYLGFGILGRGGGWFQVLIHIQGPLPYFTTTKNSAWHSLFGFPPSLFITHHLS